MLADAGTLPDGPPPPYRKWERTSYQDIYETAQALFDVCEVRMSKLGWSTVDTADVSGKAFLSLSLGNLEQNF